MTTIREIEAANQRAFDKALELTAARRRAADKAFCDAMRQWAGDEGRYLKNGRMTKGMRKAIWKWVETNPAPEGEP